MLHLFGVLTGACEECLGDHANKFWCVTSQECLPLEQKAACPNAEHHDLILNATQCCSPVGTQSECLAAEKLSFCLWCPEHVQGVELVPGKCMYKSDLENLAQNCRTQSDITSPCSQYADCESCSKDVPCAWCGSKQKCVTAFFDSQYHFQDEFDCPRNAMRFDARLEYCVCRNGYFYQN